MSIVPGHTGSLQLGVCGTDRELIDGEYGEAPAGRRRLVLGHESPGRVAEAPAGSGLAPGDTVVGIVRHPDPVPCANCALGEWDMWRNGQYTERGIKQRDGFAAQRFRSEPEFLVKVAPALGMAGVRDLGARYHEARFPAMEFDIAVECTGAPAVIAQAVAASAPGGIVCLTGLGGTRHLASFDVASLSQALVVENRVVFGSVNANRRHYEAAARALARADPAWLKGILSREVPLDAWHEAYARRENDVKTVLLFEN